MTIEHLLIPRIKVIAPYPFSPYEVGAVIEMGTDDLIEGEFFTVIKVKIESTKHFSDEIVKFLSFDDAIAALPNLFRPLKWWEHREAGDMPGYVKTKDGITCKVKKHYSLSEKYSSKKSCLCENNLCFYYDSLLPTTIDEYNNYLKVIQ